MPDGKPGHVRFGVLQPNPTCSCPFLPAFSTQCSIHFLLPAAYYLATVFEEEPGQERFEEAVLAAINAVSGSDRARRSKLIVCSAKHACVGVDAYWCCAYPGVQGGNNMARAALTGGELGGCSVSSGQRRICLVS